MSSALNFAPYEDPPGSPSTRQASKAAAAPTRSNPWMPSGGMSYQSGAAYEDLDTSRSGATGFGSTSASNAERGFGGDSHGELEVGAYETTLPIRLDVEAALAYAAGPFIAIALLLFEVSSSYVRFHAWQSLMVCGALGVLHVLLLWSSFLSWVLFLLDLVVLGSLALQAYRDSDTLSRHRLPIIGDYASRFVNEE